MATKRFNITFEDGAEYEATIYYTGAVKIRNEIGHVVFENGLYTTRDILAILERLKDGLKAADDSYDNPIEEIEEDERMELNESEICDAMAKTIVDFIDDEFTGWTDDEKATMKRLLMTFCDTLKLNLVDTECKKLDGMVME